MRQNNTSRNINMISYIVKYESSCLGFKFNINVSLRICQFLEFLFYRCKIYARIISKIEQRRNNFWETRNFQQRIRGKKRKIFQFCKDQSKAKNKPGSNSVYNITQTKNLETFDVYTSQQSFKMVKLYNQKFYLKVLLLIILKYLTHGIFFL